MGKFFRLTFILAIASLVACQDGREAGDLWGQWRLKDSDTHYLSFAGSVALFRIIPERQVYANFQHVADSLFIQCCSVNADPADTIAIESKFGMKPFTNIRLKVQTIEDQTLVLTDGENHWAFRKY
jgi:hypothetical protein